mgnify:CR=1 FL=1
MEVVEDILKQIEELSNKAIEKDGIFLFGVTGGSSTRSIYENLSKVQSDYSKWRVILLDERWVTIDDKDCNQGQVISSFLNLPGFKNEFFFGFHHESIYPDKEKSEDALVNLGKCHLSLLGVGEDGHICGLFPKFLQNDKDSSNLTIVTKDSPKPPSPSLPTGVNAERVDLSVKSMTINVTGKMKIEGETVGSPNP